MTPNKTKSVSSDNILKKEGRLFARYLLDREPPQDMIDRYISANRELGTDIAMQSTEKLMECTLTHPWSIPFLDAAAGVIQPDFLLRKKIYIMAAVLEASPIFADQFLPQNLAPFKLFARLIFNSVTAGIKMIIGIPLFYLLRKWFND
jgi:hypothetical protein